MRMPFESEGARALNRDIFETMYFAAMTASCELAEKEGPYETFQGSPVSKGIFQFDMWGEVRDVAVAAAAAAVVAVLFVVVAVINRSPALLFPLRVPTKHPVPSCYATDFPAFAGAVTIIDVATDPVRSLGLGRPAETSGEARGAEFAPPRADAHGLDGSNSRVRKPSPFALKMGF